MQRPQYCLCCADLSVDPTLCSALTRPQDPKNLQLLPPGQEFIPDLEWFHLFQLRTRVLELEVLVVDTSSAKKESPVTLIQMRENGSVVCLMF